MTPNYARILVEYTDNRRFYLRVIKRFEQMALDTDDLLQEAFLKALNASEQFNSRSKLSTWLTTIVRNQCLVALRSRRMRTIFCTLDAYDFPDLTPTTERELITTQTSAILQSVIKELPAKQRILMQRCIEGEALSSSTDKSIKYRTMPILRKRLINKI